jgi:hypothetical protein
MNKAASRKFHSSSRWDLPPRLFAPLSVSLLSIHQILGRTTVPGQVQGPPQFARRYSQQICLLIILAGTPPTKEFSGTFLVTTAPAAMIDPFPIFTPLRMIALVPIQT